MATTELDDLRRVNPRPCTFEQMQDNWQRLSKYLENAPNAGIPVVADSGWYTGGGSPYVLATINGVANVQVRIPQAAARLINIKAGDDLLIGKKNGIWWVLNPVWDDPQYTLRYMASGPVPYGWALANGVDNSVANGGSEIDYMSRFIKGDPTPGATGETNYTPTGSLSSGTVSVSGTFTTTSETTGITIPAYTGTSGPQVGMGDHRHYVYVEQNNVESGDGDLVTYEPKDPFAHDGAYANETSIDYTTGSSPGADPTPDWRAHTHTIDHSHTPTDPGHTHDVTISGSGTLSDVTFTGDAASTIEPPFTTAIIIERLNNGL